MAHGWILAKVGDRTEQVSLPLCCEMLCLYTCHSSICLLLALCHFVNMCKCLFSVVWQPILYGLASVRRAHNIQWLTEPNYLRLLPFHRGSQSDAVSWKRAQGFMPLLTTHTMRHDIISNILSIYIYMRTCFDFATCNTKFINKIRWA